MEYNSNKEILIIPEYGRHVQNMIRYARGIPEKEKRQHFIEMIVGLMMQMHPQNRNLEDYRDKLWKHVFHIAEYQLDVVSPTGYIPTPGDSRKKPDRVTYSTKDPRFRHYGHNVQKLIAKAISMEDGDKKNSFVKVIAFYMKQAYRTWSREHYVSDDVIVEDLVNLSDGKLRLVEDTSFDSGRAPRKANVGPQMPPRPQMQRPLGRPGNGPSMGMGRDRDRGRDMDRGRDIDRGRDRDMDRNSARQQQLQQQRRRRKK